MKLFTWDGLNSILYFKDLLAFRWCKRGGNAFVFMNCCGIEFTKPHPTHMRQIYVQIFNYGGNISWKSDKCYEVEK
jgi:hypothetical protein